MFLLLNDTLRQKLLTGVAFEPTHPKILRPECSALDRSPILPDKTFFVSFCFCCYICSSASDCLSQYVEKRISAMFLLLNDTLKTGTADRSGIRTHASEDTATLTQRLTPLGHPAWKKHFPNSFCFCCYICSSASDCWSQTLKNEFQRCFYC